ncbi:hypothetical protein [Chryseobacterium hagamense]|uniref:Uncharacterized protein n=1 Tax=Chryseobacterium hagamense TaxID=395935 RepID=A0A511YQG0_9FLAO|nr:hypothetical protein [Chryseobacterium hagamense]GEN77437.1 hypothetical protein CHA01nite_31770 [Chryseobacterium hagamense]
MFSPKQEQAITDYLIFHQLPLDILLEVKDHMLSQVADIQAEENKSFEEAFHKTQKLWESEFKLTRYSLFYREQIPVILKRIVKEKYNVIFRKSLLLGLASFTVNLLLIYFSADQEIYNDLFRFYNSLIVIVPFLYWIFNRKMRKYVRADFKYQKKSFFTMYQRNFGIFAVFGNFIFQMILRGDKYLFRFFRSNDPVSVFQFMLSLILPYLLHILIFFIMINFYEHKKSLMRMQNYLKISGYN